MKLSDFDFSLPKDLIATRPARPRSSARMMVCDAGARSDATMIDLPRWLVPGDRLVLNDTRVLPARLAGRRFREGADGVTSAAIEATLLRPAADGTWTALVRPQKRLREGETVVFSDRLSARLVGRDGDLAILAFDRAGAEFETELDAAGQMPLPPYIAARRPADAQDRSDYQTLWGVRPGSVAAPTASLHFDAPLLEALAARGIETTHVTLHVGAGTFLPVKVEDIAAHRMHAEWGEVGARAAAEINATIAAGGRIVPVGTTALRLIESAATGPGRIAAWQGETDIFIRPGFAFALTDALVTNFHLPRSTLLMLVSALMGVETMRDVYAHAIAERYRFFSYGDGSLLVPPRMRRLG